MATYYSDKIVASSNKELTQVPARSHIYPTWVVGTASVDTSLDAADIVKGVKVPAGALILDIILKSTDIDTDGTPAVTLHVGDSDDADRFFVSSDVGQAGGVARLTADGAVAGNLYEYSAETEINITVAVAAATAAAGTVQLAVLYVVGN